ncbi:MFS general substrate transporter [Dothidotthia symphoricarpi CBS 119687]|uniref:MFS general substrate transporter n=1 Tax=Dothidotthia symphoricarpi CBS 119687 TaxID=1392245 RepID=A0A6A6AGG1_9PLEO|nr:MFS general substrate transporter [Dothidotthia symphoricarpi CBS 119687]KAF2130138.1 MFS general substrate transporter [Dothidotthia symphoricarpi CBS 119687]
MISPSEKDNRKGSLWTLPLQNAPSDTTPSMRHPSESTTVHIVDDEPDWPRTWRAYACLLGCFFLMFNSWGLVNAYGTWSSYYVGNSLRHVDQLQLNLIGSTQCFIVLALSNPVGRLLDAGYFRQVLGVGAFLVPFGLFMLSVVHPADGTDGNFALIWVTQGLIVGLGMAPFFVSSSQIASTWFPKRRGLAVGYVACGASVAGVVYPTMLRYLIEALGFNIAVRYVATLTSVTCIYSFLFATPNPKHHTHKPESWTAIRTWFDTDAFRNKAWWWFTAAVAFMFLGFYPVFFNLEEWAATRGYGTRDGSAAPVHIQESNDKPLQTFWLLTIMNGSSTVGRMTLAHFSDRIGPMNMHIGAQFGASLLTLILWTLAGSETDAIAFCVVFGIFSGMVIGLPPASIANILSRTYTTPETAHYAKSKLGHWTGMMYSFAAIPALVGPVIAGFLVSKYETYITVQMWSGTSLVLSLACMLVSRWHLPCKDGDTVPLKLARTFDRTDTRANSVGYLEALSQAQTRVPSMVPSPRVSSEKVDTPERMV